MGYFFGIRNSFAGGVARGTQKKLEAFLAYQANPKICEFCNKPIELEGRKPFQVKTKKYCTSCFSLVFKQVPKIRVRQQDLLSTFYVYFWLREDGTPYYVGKGKEDRACDENHNVSCPTSSDRILIQEMTTEDEAYEAEIFFISYYGRIDLGTGCLRNLTDGGEGVRNYNASKSCWERMVEKHGLEKAKQIQAGPRVRGAPGKPKSLAHRQKVSAAIKILHDQGIYKYAKWNN